MTLHLPSIFLCHPREVVIYVPRVPQPVECTKKNSWRATHRPPDLMLGPPLGPLDREEQQLFSIQMSELLIQ